MTKGSLGQLAYALVIVGGIVMVLLGLTGILGMTMMTPFRMRLPGFIGYDIITLILGVFAIIGSKRISDPVWSIALIVAGYVGGGIGGLLVLIGSTLALLSRFVR